MDRQLAHQLTRFGLTVGRGSRGYRLAFEGGGFWSPVMRNDCADECDHTLLFPTLEAARSAQLAANEALNALEKVRS